MKTQFLRAIPTMLFTMLATFAVVVHADSEIYYIHNDHLGTPQVLTDKDQNVVWTADQTPFGQLENETGSVEQHIRFPGQYADQETGYYYNYYRDYDPSLGRYIQSDPIGLEGGLNTYAYVEGNPLSYSDPFGLRRVGHPGTPDNKGPSSASGNAFVAVQLGLLVVTASEQNGVEMGVAVLPGVSASIGVCRAPPPKLQCEAENGPSISGMAGVVIVTGLSGGQPCVGLGLGTPKFANITATDEL